MAGRRRTMRGRVRARWALGLRLRWPRRLSCSNESAQPPPDRSTRSSTIERLGPGSCGVRWAAHDGVGSVRTSGGACGEGMGSMPLHAVMVFTPQ